MKKPRLLLLFCLAVFSQLPADELHEQGKKTREGIFLGVSDKGKVSFQEYGEDNPQEFPAGKIRSLSLDQPVRARFFQKRGGKKSVPVLFLGMREGLYRLQFSGGKGVQEIPLLTLQKLEIDLDMKDYLQRMEKYRQNLAAELSGQQKSAQEFLVPGKIVILHFTLPRVAENSRQGNLARRLCADSACPAEYVPLYVDSLDSRIARTNGLESLPQFWFYTASGNLSARLTGRFTDQDLESAFRKAGK